MVLDCEGFELVFTGTTTGIEFVLLVEGVTGVTGVVITGTEGPLLLLTTCFAKVQVCVIEPFL